MNTKFEELWRSHTRWTDGVLVQKIHEKPYGNLYLSDIGGPYYSFSRLTEKPTDHILKEIEDIFSKSNEDASIFLSRQEQSEHITEYLVRQSYRFRGTDTWMVLNKSDYENSEVTSDIVEVNSETFDDFEVVLAEIFKEFSGNKKYLQMCRGTLNGNVKSAVEDFEAKFFVIYDGDTPVAGAGMIYSVKEDIAYLHNSGTLEKYRGKGYQTAFIRHRVNLAHELGINRMYSIVEQGTVSWANMIRNGFSEAECFLVMSKPR